MCETRAYCGCSLEWLHLLGLMMSGCNNFSVWATSDTIVVKTSQRERMLEHNNRSL